MLRQLTTLCLLATAWIPARAADPVFPYGAVYFRHHDAATRAFFLGLLGWAGVTRQVASSEAAIQARLHNGPGGAYLWVVNPAREPRSAAVTLSPAAGAFAAAYDVWGDRDQPVKGRVIQVRVEDRDAAVLRLR